MPLNSDKPSPSELQRRAKISAYRKSVGAQGGDSWSAARTKHTGGAIAFAQSLAGEIAVITDRLTREHGKATAYAISQELNRRQILPRRGQGEWCATQVIRLLDKIAALSADTPRS